MSWSYDAALGTDMDRVRFLIRDTDTSRQLFQDEEIDWTLTTEDNVFKAAAVLCDQLVANRSGVSSKKISEFSITYDTKVYQQLAMSLRARGGYNEMPYAAGISVADKSIMQTDTDAVQPKVKRRLHDYPSTFEAGNTNDDPLRET